MLTPTGQSPQTLETPIEFTMETMEYMKLIYDDMRVKLVEKKEKEKCVSGISSYVFIKVSNLRLVSTFVLENRYLGFQFQLIPEGI